MNHLVGDGDKISQDRLNYCADLVLVCRNYNAFWSSNGQLVYRWCHKGEPGVEPLSTDDVNVFKNFMLNILSILHVDVVSSLNPKTCTIDELITYCLENGVDPLP